jgi:hypothetical protein
MNRSQSRKSEADIELVTGLKRNPGSGCGKIFKGDNGDRNWHVEDKSTRQNRIVLKLHNFEKADYQSKITNKPYFAVSYTIGRCRFYHVPSWILDMVDNDVRKARTDRTVTNSKSMSFTTEDLAEMLTTRSLDIDWSGHMTSVITERDFIDLKRALEGDSNDQN